MEARGPLSVSEPVSWLLVRRGWQVLAADGTPVGRIGAVRGEPIKDIFNGIVVRNSSAPPRYVPSDLVAEIVSGRVTLKLSAEEFEAVPPEKRRPLAPSVSLSEFLRRFELRSGGYTSRCSGSERRISTTNGGSPWATRFPGF